MVRPKKSAIASRQNGAKATNKGKAKKLVPVLELGYDARNRGFEVRRAERRFPRATSPTSPSSRR